MSKEYIERKALLQDIVATVVFSTKTGERNSEIKGAKKVIGRIQAMPTADVQEVVYCKDCKHLYQHSAVDREFYCKHPKGMQGCLNPVEENPYCSCGAKIDKE